MIMNMRKSKNVNSSDIYDLALSFEDLAKTHAEALGVGLSTLLPKGLTWMVRSNRLEFHKLNTIGDTLVTWPKESGRIELPRDYLLLKGQEVLVSCRAKWFIYNFELKKICRASDIVFPGKFSQENSTDNEVDKLVEPNDLVYLKSEIIDDKYLDHNKHVNNCKYIWLFEDIIPKNIKYLQIDYKNQVLLNDKIDIYIKREENKLYIVGKVNEIISFITEIGE